MTDTPTGAAEEYRVDRIGTYDLQEYLNEAAAHGWTLATASGAGDVSTHLWVILRRPR
jgi:hypothetical protein